MEHKNFSFDDLEFKQVGVETVATWDFDDTFSIDVVKECYITPFYPYHVYLKVDGKRITPKHILYKKLARHWAFELGDVGVCCIGAGIQSEFESGNLKKLLENK